MSNKIGILDDRKKTRETAQLHIENWLEADWEVVLIPLLETPEKVVHWISHNDLKVLVIDQNLNEEAQAIPISYKGHQVVAEIRKTIPDFPVYMLTAFGGTSDVKSNQGNMEEVIDRAKFYKSSKIHVERMMRAGLSFHNRYKSDLARLSDLSKAAASGKISTSEEAELKALQTQLGLMDSRSTQDSVLTDLCEQLAQLENLQKHAQTLLKQTP